MLHPCDHLLPASGQRVLQDIAHDIKDGDDHRIAIRRAAPGFMRRPYERRLAVSSDHIADEHRRREQFRVDRQPVAIGHAHWRRVADEVVAPRIIRARSHPFAAMSFSRSTSFFERTSSES